MNVVLLVVDSLRARSLGRADAGGPRTPFFDRLASETIWFRRAYASECWTLPAHMSMFTGLLPSEHGAHFQTMAFDGRALTAAELFARAGFETEVATRNSLFDGTVPGTVAGFRHRTRPLALLGRHAPLVVLLLALLKPRVARMMRRSGFFHVLQKANRDFVVTLARMGIPADRLVLQHALEQMARHRHSGTPYFLFMNLYDVHAPYSPSMESPVAPIRSFGELRELLTLPGALLRVSAHAYLRLGFRMSRYEREMLLSRYHRAIELMDRKLAAFYEEASRAGLLDDTVLILTSDHGEAFGEHGLYFHDASVYDTHLHVPLWIHHPNLQPDVVDDVVSTRDLFGLFRGLAHGGDVRGTLLDRTSRSTNAVALAEHFHYPYTDGVLPQYAQNIAAAIVGKRKIIVRREGPRLYDLARDPDELAPEAGSWRDFEQACRRDGAPRGAIGRAAAHVEAWLARVPSTTSGSRAVAVAL